MARNANASVTPPNWASTPRRPGEPAHHAVGFPDATAYVRIAPSTAPITDEITQSLNEPMK